MYNKITLIGNLTKDPEIRYAQSGAAVTSFRVASTTKYSEREETLFIDAVAFGKLGENVSQYMSKGRRVLVEGRLSENKWQDNEGNQRSKMRIIAYTVVFLSNSKKEQSGHDDYNTIEEPF
jgi:single-strand DNA-binding protein